MPDARPPLTYQRIENQMRDDMNRLDEVQRDFTQAIDEAAMAEAKFKVEYAKARISARANLIDGKKRSETAADDWATEHTEDLRIDWLVKQAKQDAARQALNSTRARLEALRSLMASHRDPTGSN